MPYYLTVGGIACLVIMLICCLSFSGICVHGLSKKGGIGLLDVSNDPDINGKAADFLLKYQYSWIRQKFLIVPILNFISIITCVVGSWFAVKGCVEFYIDRDGFYVVDDD